TPVAPLTIYNPRTSISQASSATLVSTCAGGNRWRDPDPFYAQEGCFQGDRLLAGVEDDGLDVALWRNWYHPPEPAASTGGAGCQ
ncbi:unnamed protein product, partial [Urochloa humidicola]